MFSCNSSTILDDFHPPLLSLCTVLLGKRWADVNERWQSTARTEHELYEDARGLFGGARLVSTVHRATICVLISTPTDLLWPSTVQNAHRTAIGHSLKRFQDIVKVLSHYNVLVQSPTCVCEKKYLLSRTFMENVSKNCKNLPIRWPDCVHVQSFYRSCTAQTKLRATHYPGPGPADWTTSPPSILHVQVHGKIILVNFILKNNQHAPGVHFYRLFSLFHVGWARVRKWGVVQRILLFIPLHRTVQDLYSVGNGTLRSAEGWQRLRKTVVKHY